MNAKISGYSLVFPAVLLFGGAVVSSLSLGSDSSRKNDSIESLNVTLDNSEPFRAILSLLEGFNAPTSGTSGSQVDGNGGGGDGSGSPKDEREGDNGGENGAATGSSEDALRTILTYLGDDSTRIISYIAQMAAAQANGASQSSSVTPEAIVENISATLQSQEGGFHYDKVKEAIYNWASFYLSGVGDKSVESGA